jgi:hypothetical protein
MKWTWGSIIFTALKASRDATTIKELESAAALLDTMGVNAMELEMNKKVRLGAKLSPERVAAIQESCRLGILLEPRYVPEQKLWRTTYRPSSKASSSWRPASYHYFWPQLLKVAEVEGFGSRPDVWQMSGALWTYSSRTNRKVKLRWAWKDSWGKATDRFNTLTTVCNKGCDSGWTVEIVMMVQLRLYLRMLKPLRYPNGTPVLDSRGLYVYAARDELGLELQPIIRHRAADVLGHGKKGHDKPMSHGYPNSRPSLEDQVKWDVNDCNVELQSKLLDKISCERSRVNPLIVHFCLF